MMNPDDGLAQQSSYCRAFSEFQNPTMYQHFMQVIWPPIWPMLTFEEGFSNFNFQYLTGPPG
jgi:hypothetical protein